MQVISPEELHIDPLAMHLAVNAWHSSEIFNVQIPSLCLMSIYCRYGQPLDYRMMLIPVPMYVSNTARPPSYGENTYFAISCFWQIHTSSDSALTRFKNCLRATNRPGLPMMWGCRAKVIILGLPFLPSASKTSNALFRCSRKSSGLENPGASTNLWSLPGMLCQQWLLGIED